MTREKIIQGLQFTIEMCLFDPMTGAKRPKEVLNDLDKTTVDACEGAIKLLEQEPCCNCIEFKRYAKQMGFSIEKESIPYLMHKEMDISISECQKAYDIALEYLRSQGKLKG